MTKHDNPKKQCLLFFASMCVGVPCIPALLQRIDIRKKYNLQGDVVMDFAGVCCCGCCSLVQMEKEVVYREGEGKGLVGNGMATGEGYKKGEGMVYAEK
jgi:hypothetical protein